MEEERIKKAVSLLIEWYRENQRELPWRREPDGYAVWISEIMLQQTRIEAVIPYYERFMKELPDVKALANVSEERLLKLWEGLGYYSRARNLRKAAEIIMENGGSLPAEAEKLRKLPGIGDYTAGAISSIAFGQPEPAVDGNVLRVIMRLLARDDDVLAPNTKKTVAAMLREFYPFGKDAALLTEGLMELGETLCLPNGEPKCGSCPLCSLCLAKERDLSAVLPVRKEKAPRRIEERTVFLISCGGKTALCRRPEKGLLAGLWEFPNTLGKLTPEEAGKWLSERGFSAAEITPCGSAKHVFTHVEWHMIGYRVTVEEEKSCVWKTPEEIRDEFAVPSAFSFFIGKILP